MSRTRTSVGKNRASRRTSGRNSLLTHARRAGMRSTAHRSQRRRVPPGRCVHTRIGAPAARSCTGARKTVESASSSVSSHGALPGLQQPNPRTRFRRKRYRAEDRCAIRLRLLARGSCCYDLSASSSESAFSSATGTSATGTSATGTSATGTSATGASASSAAASAVCASSIGLVFRLDLLDGLLDGSLLDGLLDGLLDRSLPRPLPL